MFIEPSVDPCPMCGHTEGYFDEVSEEARKMNDRVFYFKLGRKSINTFSKRENEIFDIRGLTNPETSSRYTWKEIGENLGIHRETARTHYMRAMDKVDAMMSEDL